MCGGPEQRYNHMHTALCHPYKDAWRMQSQIHQPHSRPGAESFLTSHSPNNNFALQYVPQRFLGVARVLVV